MSGIYIHIPFCKKACYYCDFHFSTSQKNKQEIVDSLIKEIQLRKEYLPDKKIQSIYFGGGTPSLLSSTQIHSVLNEIQKHFSLSENCEITLEANPDDLSISKLKELKNCGINRLSIGVQSFFDEDLEYFNRSHSAKNALESIQTAQQEGFENITIDFMYGFPLLSTKKWKQNIQMALKLKIPHISAYSLTIEKGTALHHFISKGKYPPLNEENAVKHFQILCKMLRTEGFAHYEISNFALPGFYSAHNTSYWQQKNYLGIGPSAHSFNGNSRQWNVANNIQYIKKINNLQPFFEKEQLSEATRYNEYILTSFRTMWGVEKKYLQKKFANFLPAFTKQKEKYLTEKYLTENQTRIVLTEKGKLFADQIASDFFIV